MTLRASSGSEALPDDIAPVRLPDAARTFEMRTARFRALAPGHAAADYLAFLGEIAEAQALACRELPVSLDARRVRSPVPIQANGWPRTDAWRQVLGRILGRVGRVLVPAETAESMARLTAMPTDELERLASAITEGAVPPDPAAAVFVMAALQVCWTKLASLVPLALLHHPAGRHCPVCGSLPVAGVVLGDQPLRYLTCSLCASSWHLTRLTCAHCGSTADLSYYSIEGGAPGLKAEACARCRRFVKLFYLEQMPWADPLADDVASVALDLLMAHDGFTRGGANPFLIAAS
jgi:FdhE protein